VTGHPGHLSHARRVADAVLYEGYLLYPYRQSACKNQARFQFGVLMPPAYLACDGLERSQCQTECLAEGPDGARIEIIVRYLQLQRRSVQQPGPGGAWHDVAQLQVGGTGYTAWDEAVAREQRLTCSVASLAGPGLRQPFRSPAGQTAQDLPAAGGGVAGRLVRRWSQLDGLICAQAGRVAGPYQALRLRIRVENRTRPPAPPRDRAAALPHALLAAHVLAGIDGGGFLSMTDPPEWAAAEVAACANSGIWPVLAGPPECRSLMLSCPVILPDHPQVAPESAGETFDATEIDEILTLRTLALTDEEKRQARATDPRAAALLDRVEGLPPEMLERMHGAIRYLAGTPAAGAPAGCGSPPGPPGLTAPAGPAGPAAQPPWWDPGADTTVSPETDHVVIGGVRVARGALIRMRPGARRADAQDLFLAGREARVEAVLFDVDGQVHVAVSPVLDPLAELQRGHGRFLYFAPDEIEPVSAGPPGADGPGSPAGAGQPGPPGCPGQPRP
jgi:hypothetical protein